MVEQRICDVSKADVLIVLGLNPAALEDPIEIVCIELNLLPLGQCKGDA